MMLADDDNIKRAFQQMQEMILYTWNGPVQAVSNLPTPPPPPIQKNPQMFLFGAAISFITTAMVLSIQLSKEKRLTPQAQAAQEREIALAVSQGILHVLTRKKAPNESDAAADLRHLRNCFGHGNWNYTITQITNASQPMVLHDYDTKGKGKGKQKIQRTWDAKIELKDLINLAQRIMVETHNSGAPSNSGALAPATTSTPPAA